MMQVWFIFVGLKYLGLGQPALCPTAGPLWIQEHDLKFPFTRLLFRYKPVGDLAILEKRPNALSSAHPD